MTTKSKKNAPVLKKVELEEPIKREGADIKELTLRKPNSGELRGLSLFELANLEVNALHKLIPRIAQPSVTEADMRNLSIGDLMTLGTEVSGFLQPKSVKEEQFQAE